MTFRISVKSLTFLMFISSFLYSICVCPVFASAEATAIEIPKSARITVDGKMSEDEWKDALAQELRGGGQLKLNHDGEYLQIGLKDDKAGLSHVYLTDGKDIFVLHSSARLAIAVYQKEGEIWQPIQKFNWELMGQNSNSEATITYLTTNSWRQMWLPRQLLSVNTKSVSSFVRAKFFGWLQSLSAIR